MEEGREKVRVNNSEIYWRLPRIATDPYLVPPTFKA